MRFPRNAKIFRGQLEVAPWAGLFFLLMMFFLLKSMIFFTPGILIHLPKAAQVQGVTTPTVTIMVDASGTFFYDDQVITPVQLAARLEKAVKRNREPVTLIVEQDRAAATEVFVRLSDLARKAGIHQVLIASRPAVRRPGDPPRSRP